MPQSQEFNDVVDSSASYSKALKSCVLFGVAAFVYFYLRIKDQCNALEQGAGDSRAKAYDNDKGGVSYVDGKIIANSNFCDRVEKGEKIAGIAAAALAVSAIVGMVYFLIKGQIQGRQTTNDVDGGSRAIIVGGRKTTYMPDRKITYENKTIYKGKLYEQQQHNIALDMVVLKVDDILRKHERIVSMVPGVSWSRRKEAEKLIRTYIVENKINLVNIQINRPYFLLAEQLATALTDRIIHTSYPLSTWATFPSKEEFAAACAPIFVSALEESPSHQLTPAAFPQAFLDSLKPSPEGRPHSRSSSEDTHHGPGLRLVQLGSRTETPDYDELSQLETGVVQRRSTDVSFLDWIQNASNNELESSYRQQTLGSGKLSGSEMLTTPPTRVKEIQGTDRMRTNLIRSETHYM